MLKPEEKQDLLRIARRAVRKAAGEESEDEQDAAVRSPGKPSGAFVTVRVGGELRGCIGYVQSAKGLAEVVGDAARKAALEDPRFPPLDPSELPQSTIEVSVLSELEPVRSSAEIEVGVHGLMIELDFQRGLLLPQVAVEQGWNSEEFLEGVTRKAGLPRGSWKSEASSVFRFTTEVIDGHVMSDE